MCQVNVVREFSRITEAYQLVYCAPYIKSVHTFRVMHLSDGSSGSGRPSARRRSGTQSVHSDWRHFSLSIRTFFVFDDDIDGPFRLIMLNLAAEFRAVH